MSVINQITVGNTTYDVQDLISRPILTQAQYNALEAQGLIDPDVDYHISDGLSVQTPIDDNSISTEKVWSSKKVSDSLPQTFEFDVKNVNVNSAWGGGYYIIQTYDTGIDLTNKKVFVSYMPSTNYQAWAYISGISNTELSVIYARFTTGSINGKLQVMVTD